MTIKALNKTFIVKRIKTLESAGGILLQNDQDRNPPVEIVAIGPKVEVQCHVGQQLAIDWGRAGKFTHESQELFIVHESNVLGVFE